MSEQKEQRRTYGGSVYWLRQVGSGWAVTADGVMLSAPKTYQAALSDLWDVAPISECDPAPVAGCMTHDPGMGGHS
jgi:hypothetical protein